MTQIIRQSGRSRLLGTTDHLRTSALIVAFALSLGGTGVAETITNSVGDYSGVQGQDGWSYGYYDLTADPDETYSAIEFVPFPADFWNGGGWDWPDGNPPWTSVSIDRAHPTGAPGPDEHWAIRRWTSEQAETILICGRFAKFNVGGGNGTTCRVVVDGEELITETIEFDDTTGITFDLEIAVDAGTTVDFVLDSLGTDGTRDTLFDSSRLSCTISTTCRQDIDGNGAVDFGDLLTVLAAWGPCDGCPEDLLCDGSVDFADVLAVIGTWGACR